MNIPIIKAITLDLDDTLWPIWPTIKRAENKLYQWLLNHAPKTGQSTTTEELSTIRVEIEEQHPERKYDLSFLRKESIKKALSKYGDSPALADEAFQVYFDYRQKIELFEDALPALQRLSQYYPIVGVTNGNADLKIIGLSHFFQNSISAQNIGITKPDERIFQAAAKVLGIQNPAHILHIGDDFKLDVAGAKSAGFKTAWIKRPSLEIADAPKNELNKADFIVKDLLELCDNLNLK